jgi:MYXO-CTERM domain-containing protein
MRVEQTTGPTDTFGPFFGVEAFDTDATSLGLLASLGVDATTGEVLYQIQDTGNFTAPGQMVAFGSWHTFHIQLDYFTHTAMMALDGSVIASTGFVDHNNVPGGLNEFTDATISALAAAGDAASQALTGTAFFDNFIVIQDSLPCLVPEPASWALAALGLAAVGTRRRSAK